MSSGMMCHVVLYKMTNVPEALTAAIIRAMSKPYASELRCRSRLDKAEAWLDQWLRGWVGGRLA
jgi:hypothetical protein